MAEDVTNTAGEVGQNNTPEPSLTLSRGHQSSVLQQKMSLAPPWSSTITNAIVFTVINSLVFESSRVFFSAFVRVIRYLSSHCNDNHDETFWKQLTIVFLGNVNTEVDVGRVLLDELQQPRGHRLGARHHPPPPLHVTPLTIHQQTIKAQTNIQHTYKHCEQ